MNKELNGTTPPPEPPPPPMPFSEGVKEGLDGEVEEKPEVDDD